MSLPNQFLPNQASPNTPVTAVTAVRPLPHFADQATTYGMVAWGNVSEDQVKAAELGYNPETVRQARGHEFNLKSAWDYIASNGFQTPVRRPDKPGKQKTSGDPASAITKDEIFEINYSLGKDSREQALNQANKDFWAKQAAQLWGTSNPALQQAAQYGINPKQLMSELTEDAMKSDLGPWAMNRFDQERVQHLASDHYTYTGSDLRVLIDLPGYQGAGRQLAELTTITVSIHREKAPVRASGFVNPKGFAYGRRTIAGTMILTQFWIDSLLRFLFTYAPPAKSMSYDAWVKDLSFRKIDQLPPFNLTFLFADELGHASVRRLLGVTIVTDGTVYSVNDQMTEQTLSYMATDFTPLMPLDAFNALRDAPKSEKTPKDVYVETFDNTVIDPFRPNKNLDSRLASAGYRTARQPPPAPSGLSTLATPFANIYRKVKGIF